jgi:hypothetical protein
VPSLEIGLFVYESTEQHIIGNFVTLVNFILDISILQINGVRSLNQPFNRVI